jgi:hypothetical protein
MSTHTTNQTKQNQNQNQIRDDRRIPKRNPARILWECPLDEWDEFMSGDLSADELKQRYGADETGGDAA